MAVPKKKNKKVKYKYSIIKKNLKSNIIKNIYIIKEQKFKYIKKIYWNKYE